MESGSAGVCEDAEVEAINELSPAAAFIGRQRGRGGRGRPVMVWSGAEDLAAVWFGADGVMVAHGAASGWWAGWRQRGVNDRLASNGSQACVISGRRTVDVSWCGSRGAGALGGSRLGDLYCGRGCCDANMWDQRMYRNIWAPQSIEAGEVRVCEAGGAYGRTSAEWKGAPVLLAGRFNSEI